MEFEERHVCIDLANVFMLDTFVGHWTPVPASGKSFLFADVLGVLESLQKHSQV